MKNEIIELREKGFSYNEIREKLGCSKSTISYHCSKLESNSLISNENLDIKNKKQEKIKSFLLSDEKIKIIIELRKLKKTYKEIKKETNFTLHTISKVCREFDLVKKRKYGSLNDIEILKIKKIYDDNKSLRKTAKETGISRETIRKYVTVNYIRYKNISDSQSVVNWRKRTKDKLVEYKGGKCQICGYKKSIKALHFHHLDPTKKDFTISGKSWSFERLKKEVDKCILVCSNCHCEIHENK